MSKKETKIYMVSGLLGATLGGLAVYGYYKYQASKAAASTSPQLPASPTTPQPTAGA